MLTYLNRFALTAALLASILAGSSASALEREAPTAAPPAPDVEKLGPQVGSTVATFSLPDQNGRNHTLDSLMGPKGLMLIFSRSVDWCPYCKTQMVEMQGRLEDLRKNGLGVAVITYDPVRILADFAARRKITFPLLSDAGSAVIKQYGILNTTVDPGNALFGYPFPGTFIVDRQRVVTSRYFEPGFQERNTVSSLLVRLGNQVNVPATNISSPQIDITSYATDDTAAPGTHFSVVLDVRPGPRIHVYAPGATGYKPIALAIDPQPGLIVRDAQYPQPEDYHFVPLDEHVQVYQKPFRIVQDLMIDPSRDGQAALRGASAVTVNGTLSYQACDDKVCFSPQTVRLSYRVKLRALDTERATPQ